MDKFEQEQPGAPRNHSPEETGSQLSLWPAVPTQPAAFSPPVPEREPPWSLADVGAFILFVVFSFFLSGLLAVAVFLALRQHFSWRITLEEAFAHAPFVVLLQTGWEILWLFFIYFIITVKYRRRFWEAIRWLREPRPG
ncbi:MAG: hypothetical protein HY648_04775, partial [Acidobacteria bacterium]|nr:hypothetical protein [Acidobacteriota bacterium]